jgi:dTDP-4-amino-4,6-dideoxygalactose transaminase
MNKIQMVDVQKQYQHIKAEVDQAVQSVIDSAAFINGPAVKQFKASLESYLDVSTVIPVANGTDALQIALMALGLKPGDKVMVPAFTYVATAEVIALLGLQPVMVDVDPHTFNLTAEIVEAAMADDIKCIVPVHLYGQCAEMEAIQKIADKYGVPTVEDDAQAIGADYIFADGSRRKSGTIGTIGCTSFYPSKNLGAYGDGGAMFCNDPALGEQIRMVANHGQSKRYYHDVIGCNSRLDSIQAAILDIKLKHLDDYCDRRRAVADAYDTAFAETGALITPVRADYSTHVFHQYTLKVTDGRRDELKAYLQEHGVPSMIYYPVPLYKQEAFKQYVDADFELAHTEELCQQVISLPIHTEMQDDQLAYIIKTVKLFYA